MHPPNWKVATYVGTNNKTGIYLEPFVVRNATFRSRVLPRIHIGDSPYSTSGSICANQICDYNGAIKVNLITNSIYGSIVKASIIEDDDVVFDFYSFGFSLDESKEDAPYLWASWGTEEEGQLIANILSTIK